MSLKHNVVANYLGAIWNALMALAFVPLYIKYLGMESYALIGIFAMLQGWLSLLDMGMSPALSREMARFTGGGVDPQSIRNLLRSIEVICYSIAAFFAFIIWGGSGWLASGWLKAESLPLDVVSQAIAITGLVIALRFVENIYRSSILGLQRHVMLNVLSSGMATLRGLGAVGVLLYVSPTIHAYFIWQGIISLATVGLLSSIVYRTLPASVVAPTFSSSALKKIWRFAIGSLALTALSLLLTQVDKLLLSRLLTLTAFGYYVFAVGVAQTPFIAVAPITQAFFPRFTQLMQKEDSVGLTAAYHTAAQLVTVLLGSATVILMLFGNDILALWTGDNSLAESTYRLVAVLSLGGLLNGLMTIPYNLQLSAGWTGLMIKINLVVVLIVIPALLWVVPGYGAIGAAWIWVFINAAYVVVAIQLMHTRLLPGEKLRWYLWDVCIPLFAILATALLLRSILPVSHQSLMEVIRLGICSLLVGLAGVFAAPMIRIRFMRYIPALSSL